jgi:hypothetical protein
MSIITNVIKRFVAPALPNATEQYDQKYFDKYNSILRLYFNQLDQLLGQLVSTSSTVPVSIGGVNVDAFGRVRSSSPYTLFDSQNRYEKNDLFSETTATGGTVTYDADASTVLLNVTTTSGSEVVRQSFRSFSYQPGKGLLTFNTFVMGTAKTGVRMRVGYFNTQNGVFLERANSDVKFVRRTSTSGSPVDVPVLQANWNGDKLDGTGDSGLTLDLTKAQILWSDFEWLGVGSVRCGFVINGQFIICHTFENANNLDSVYMTTAILPIRYEVTNTDTTASATSFKQICSSVISEGGYEKKVALNVARMTAANTNIGTSFVPLVSLRLASGRTGAVVIPDGYSVLPTAASSVTFEIVLVKNPTLTGPSWVATTSTNVEADLSATAYTGGTIVQQQFVLASTQSSGIIAGGGDYNWDLQLGATIGGTSDIYTVAIRTLSGTHTAIGSLSFWDLT